MKKYEYKMEMIDYVGNEHHVHHPIVDLKELGENGWLLICTITAGPYVKGYFSREIVPALVI